MKTNAGMRILLWAAATLWGGVAYAQLGNAEGTVSARSIRVPLYNNGELRFMLRANAFDQKGALLNANGAVVDIVKKKSDIDNLKIGGFDFYVINSSIVPITRFWGERTSSEGVIYSETAQVDNTKNSIESPDVVQVRTPMMDIDGVGFSANYKTRQVTVKQNVHIVLRTGGGKVEDVIRSGDEALAAASAAMCKSADVWSDTLSIDFEEKVVTLEGDVRLEQDESVISCDRVELLLGRRAKGDDKDDDDDGISGGVSQVECFGSVRMMRKTGEGADSLQSVNSDYAKYDFETRRIYVSGGAPEITSGNNRLSGDQMEYSNRTGQLDVTGNCRLRLELPNRDADGDSAFTTVSADTMSFSYPNNYAEAAGNVKINDERGSLHAQTMTLQLTDRSENTGADGDEDVGLANFGGLDFSTGGKTVDTIVCSGGVDFFGRNGEEGRAETVTYDYGTGAITLSGQDSRPWVRQGANRLEGGSIAVDDRGRGLTVKDEGVISIRQDDGDSTVEAAEINMDFSGNYGVLKNGVKVTTGDSTVECDELRLYLTGDAAASDAGRGFVSGEVPAKALSKLVCSGNVRASAPSGKLTCDELEMLFPPGGSSREPERVNFNGNVKLTGANVAMLDPDGEEDAAFAAARTPEGAESSLASDSGYLDVPGNLAYFAGNVKVDDPRLQVISDEFTAFFAMNGDEPEAPAADEPSPELAESPELAFEPGGESRVPRFVKIGDDRNLRKLLFTGNVTVAGTDADGHKFFANGDNASYLIPERMMEMVEANGIKPVLSRGATSLECEQVVVDLGQTQPEPSAYNWKILSFEPNWE